MSGFSADWLALREPVDAEARAAALTGWIREGLPTGRPVRILDLATGTGSNFRYLAPSLGDRQHWQLADHDPALLAALPARIAGWAVQRHWHPVDTGAMLTVSGPQFDASLERVEIDLAAGLGRIDFGRFDLVTTSALLDLVSEAWLTTLVERCTRARCAVLFALSYDGRIELTPPEAGDAPLRERVNRHQRSDKGFGPALGPEAAARTVALLRDAGQDVRSMRSDWQIDARHPALQGELIRGWAAAALELGEDPALRAWCERRLSRAAAGQLHVCVGHLDVAARPVQ